MNLNATDAGKPDCKVLALRGALENATSAALLQENEVPVHDLFELRSRDSRRARERAVLPKNPLAKETRQRPNPCRISGPERCLPLAPAEALRVSAPAVTPFAARTRPRTTG